MIQRALLLLVTIFYPLQSTFADDWPQWHGPDRTGLSKETGLLSSWPAGGPKRLWTFRDAGAGYSGMSVVGNRLYSLETKNSGPDTPRKDYVYAVDLLTRKRLWTVEVGLTGVSGIAGSCSTPTIDGDLLYALGSDGDLVCVETNSGKKVWAQGLKTTWGGWANGCGGFTESPLVDGDQVVATPGGKKGGAVAAFNKKTGALKWRSTLFTAERACYSSMIAVEMGGVRQYVQIVYDITAVGGVRASDGKLLWKHPCRNGWGYCTPIYRNNHIYVSGEGDPLLNIMIDGGNFKAGPIYTNENVNFSYGGVVLVGDYFYGCCGDGVWTCQNFKTGKRVWQKNSRLGHASVMFANGNLYGYHERKGDVVLIQATPTGYQEQGRFRIPEETKIPRMNSDDRIYTHPVVANGKLYLRDQDLIFCYEVRKPQ